MISQYISKRNIRTIILIPSMLFITALITLATFLVSQQMKNVTALSGTDFNPGRIIDDVIFYDSSSMSASQIQTFFNSKVPTCDTQGTGSSGYGNTRAEYAATQGWHAPPYTCLKDYKQNTPQMEAASSLCSALSAKNNQTAAQIIYSISVACGINPQVLITLLEKEQGLVTDVWPLTRQFEKATGFACPDSAPCNTAYAGFFYQIYHAARQFKVYKTNPKNYSYQAGRTSTIYYHPDTSRCGNSQVYIENQATAALYIYTPYQPNKAALENVRGTGDSCSSYGNRNFWWIFTNWFGDATFTTKGSIGEKYTAYGKSKLGVPVSSEITLSTGGKYQQFEKGRIYWKSGLGAWVVLGSISEEYTKNLSADRSALGYPISDEQSTGDNIKMQQFEGGRIYWKKGIGAHSIYGSIGEYYVENEAENSNLGIPTSNEIKLSTGGVYQQFEKGRIYWKSGTGAWTVGGSIGNRYYNELKADMSALGYPTSEEKAGINGSRYQEFEKGYIYWRTKVGAHSIYGDIGKRYTTLESEEITLGIPISNEKKLSTGGVYQQFEKGRIYWKKSSGAWDIAGSIGNRYYAELKADQSALGYPISKEVTVEPGVKYQNFEGGRIYWKTKVGVFSVYGSIGLHYTTISSHESRLGLPISNEKKLSTGGVYQQFEKGRIYWKKSSGAWDIAGSIGALFYSLGGDKSKLGYPKSTESGSVSTSIIQQYEYGTITYKDRKTTYKLK